MANTIFETGLSEFEQSVLQRSYEQPVLIDLWAEWCPPCIALDPVLRNVVEEYEGTLIIELLNRLHHALQPLLGGSRFIGM